MTKANKGIVASYNRSTKTSLWQCYESFSNKKQEAWEYCEKLMQKYKGHDLKVISSNGWMFTAGFMFEDEDGCEFLMYITKSDDKVILIDEEV